MNRRHFFSRILSLLGILPALVSARPEPQSRPVRNLTLLTTQLAGFQYYEGERVWKRLRPRDTLTLRREPENTHDRRAVEVYWGNHKLGYLPHRDNAVIAQLLDRGTTLQARITHLETEDDPWERVGLEIKSPL